MAAGGPRLKASDREGTETSVHIMRAKAMLSLVSSRSPYRVSLNSAKGLTRHPLLARGLAEMRTTMDTGAHSAASLSPSGLASLFRLTNLLSRR